LPAQKICPVAAREFEDGEVLFGGVGIAFLAVAIAKLVHNPTVILIAEAGYIGFAGVSSMGSPSDNWGGTMAMCHQGLPETFIDNQAGFMDAACLGFAQMDKYGNANVTYIVNPDIRMNGSGGGGDIVSSCGRIVYTIEYNARQWVNQCDYLTEPGFLDGSPDARKKAGLIGNGPAAMVSDRGIFRFDENHEVYLSEVFPWQDEADIEEIVKANPWGLKVAKDLKIIEPPTERELEAMKLMDPNGGWTIANLLDRPVGKILREGRVNLSGTLELLRRREATIREAMDILS
jgi:glutaconate CoA-transferase, subunit B